MKSKLAIFSDEDRTLLGRIAGHRSPDADSWEPEKNGKEKDSPAAATRRFAAVLRDIGERYDYLCSMAARRLFLGTARQTLSIGSIGNYNWKDARELLVVFMKLLYYYGWVLESLIERVRHALTASSDHSKNVTLFTTLSSIPFGIVRQPCLDIVQIEETLNKSLYGMDQVKREIVDEIVLASHASGVPSVTPMLLVGPPGNGKTAIGEAVAAALDLPFFKAGLGGNCDTIYLRGSSFAWGSATIGYFTRTLINAECENPVVLLDEIDKSGGYSGGDLIDSLTEALDVTQSATFEDLFLLGVPINLSRIFYLASANTLSAIPDYITDRCRVIDVPPYKEHERRLIIRDYLPRQVQRQKALPFRVTVSDQVASSIARESDSLRVAKVILTSLVARKLRHRTPGTVRQLRLTTWDPACVVHLRRSSGRRIGFVVQQNSIEK